MLSTKYEHNETSLLGGFSKMQACAMKTGLVVCVIQ